MRAPNVFAVRAFKARERSLRPLPGGQGEAWSDGSLVLKPVGYPPETEWVCDVFAAWTHHDSVRVPQPIRSQDDTWIAHGWAAHVLLPGRDAVLLDELDVVHEASRAFHAAVADLDRPGFMDDRDDPWALGDRVAWEGAAAEGDARTLALVDRLRAALAPTTAPHQVIHGDILPNVIVERGKPPGVIDWPPYHRPAAFADAIAATDAVTFRGAPYSLFDDWADGDDWDQLLLRAVLYRLGPTGFFAARDRLLGSLVTHVERAEPVVDHLLERAGANA